MESGLREDHLWLEARVTLHPKVYLIEQLGALMQVHQRPRMTKAQIDSEQAKTKREGGVPPLSQSEQAQLGLGWMVQHQAVRRGQTIGLTAGLIDQSWQMHSRRWELHQSQVGGLWE